MKRRLRKKKRVGEFQEFGFEVGFDIPAGLRVPEQNAVLHDFITEAVEANGLQCGGGGDTRWRGFVALDRPRGSATDRHREAVRTWLEQHPRISGITVGELRDAWYGWDDD